MEETNMSVLSDNFNLYMENGKKAKDKGNISLAKRNFLLASETMMQMAKQSQGKLKQIRMERARRLVEISDNLNKKPVKENKKSEEDEDDTLTKWQTATVPDVKFSDVAGLDDVKKACQRKQKKRRR